MSLLSRRTGDAVEEGAEKSGLSPSRSTWRIAREVYVADTTEQARKEALEGTLGRDFRDYWFKLFSPQNFKPSDDVADADMSLEHLLDTLWIVGSPDHVANRLRELYDEVGGLGSYLPWGTSGSRGSSG